MATSGMPPPASGTGMPASGGPPPAMQWPPAQIWAAAQAVPQAPQCWVLACMFTHSPPQAVKPCGQRHWPATHSVPPNS